jgi:hypothetical protein
MKGDPDAVYRGITARRYIKIIQEYLLTILDFNSIFMQDNSSLYIAYLTQDWLRDNSIYRVDWLPYSPDINPIENLWKILKAKIIELYPELIIMKDNDSTRTFLIQAVEEAWELLEEELLNKLALEMQKRIDALKAAQGWYTKY